MDDLDRATAFFNDVLGMPIVSRGPSEVIEGETATLDAGPVAITLLAPRSHGPGPVLPNRQPRVSQLVLGAHGETRISSLQAELAEAGLPIVPVDGAGFFITPEAALGALGIATAVVFVPHPDVPS